MTLHAFACALPFGCVRGLRRAGDGRRVLALHGWLDNAASFVPLAEHLPAGLDLALPDLPGHGHSDWLPAGADYTLPGAVAHVLALADALGWERFTLIGHSMGAGIASLVAAAAPARVQALVAIETLGGLGERVENTATRLREAVAAMRAPARPLRVFPDLAAPVRARMMANRIGADSARRLVERGVEAVEGGGWRWRSDRRLALPTAVRMTEAQIEALVAAIECPVQAIFATPAPAYFPEPQRRRRAALLRHGRLAMLPGVHHLHMEDAATVARIVRDFLEALPA